MSSQDFNDALERAAKVAETEATLYRIALQSAPHKNTRPELAEAIKVAEKIRDGILALLPAPVAAAEREERRKEQRREFRAIPEDNYVRYLDGRFYAAKEERQADRRTAEPGGTKGGEIMQTDDKPIAAKDEPPGTILVGSQTKRAYLFLSMTEERMERERMNAYKAGVDELREFYFVLDGEEYVLSYRELKAGAVLAKKLQQSKAEQIAAESKPRTMNLPTDGVHARRPTATQDKQSNAAPQELPEQVNFPQEIQPGNPAACSQYPAGAAPESPDELLREARKFVQFFVGDRTDAEPLLARIDAALAQGGANG